MKCWLIFFVLIFSQLGLTQNDPQWRLDHFYKSTDINAWDVDPMGKVILAERDVLVKLDTSFVPLFTQSTKQIGEIAFLDAAHSLKTLVFSEMQQYISFVDNTMTFQEGIKDLTTYGIAYATNVCYSNQTNRFWVFDGDNAQLLLIDQTGGQISKINNLSSITGGVQPKVILERNNELLVFYEGVGVFFFDYYGSLISQYESMDTKAVHFNREYLYLVNDREIKKINRKTNQHQIYKLPDIDILEVRVLGEVLFIQTPEGIKKYILITD